ncbi:hypothetical protein [Legionella sp. 16cNR16C]|uniref:hypothetical protein n=1 Tax=Legionella sp. 16cNR16C TaxID=2905656 RepID=UPI001E34EF5C|nr:hypothetical protein [Legionella sp. 16cNR16C]MCE3044690.1 hypothetical protein [Legionella sp. 16cNR16C]
MKTLYNLCNEIQEKELKILEVFSSFYKENLEVLREVNKENLLNEMDIRQLEIYLYPFKKIYSLIAPNTALDSKTILKFFTLNHLKVTPEDSEDELIKKLLMLIASPAFLSIRKAAALALSQYKEANQFYQRLAEILAWPSLKSRHLQDKHIICAQIFSQFAILGKELFELNQSTGSRLISETFANIAESANQFIAPEPDTIKELERLEAIKQELQNQLNRLEQEARKVQQASVALQLRFQIAEQMMQSTDKQKQNQLYSKWKDSSSLLDFPSDSLSLVKLSQEIAELETQLQQRNADLEPLQKQIGQVKRLLDKSQMEITLHDSTSTINVHPDVPAWLNKQYKSEPVQTTFRVVIEENLASKENPEPTESTPSVGTSKHGFLTRARSLTNLGRIRSSSSPLQKHASSEKEKTLPQSSSNTEAKGKARIQFFTDKAHAVEPLPQLQQVIKELKSTKSFSLEPKGLTG